MSRALLVINADSDRGKVAQFAHQVPIGTRVDFKAAKRSLDQNSKMWAMLTDIARQLPWHGVRLRPDDWKLLFLDALKRELRVVPNLDGTGFVNLGRSSADLSKEEMSDLLEVISEFGARHSVKFGDDEEAAA
jgi:hypothetical protein